MKLEVLQTVQSLVITENCPWTDKTGQWHSDMQFAFPPFTHSLKCQ